MVDKNKIANDLLLKQINAGIDYSTAYAIVTKIEDFYCITIFENGSSCAMAKDTLEDVKKVLKNRGIADSNVEWYI